MLCLVEGCEKGPFQFAMLISIQITFSDATSFLLLFWFKLLGGQEIRGLKKKDSAIFLETNTAEATCTLTRWKSFYLPVQSCGQFWYLSVQDSRKESLEASQWFLQQADGFSGTELTFYNSPGKLFLLKLKW